MFAIIRKVSKDGMKRYVQLYEIRSGVNGNSLYDVTLDIASILKEKTKSIKKNNYRLEIIENFIKIFEKWNLNEESLDFIIKLLEKRKNEKQNTNLNQKIEIFFWNSSLSIYWEIFKEKIWFLIFSIIYFTVYFCNFNYIKDFLIEFSKK